MRHSGINARSTIDVTNRNAKNPAGVVAMEAPVLKSGDSSLIEYRLPNALEGLNALNCAVCTNVERENAAAGEVVRLRLSWVLWPWSIHDALACRLRDKWDRGERTCYAQTEKTLHRPNETELSHRWRRRALLSLYPS